MFLLLFRAAYVLPFSGFLSRGLFPRGLKWPEREGDHRSPSNAKLKMYIHLLQAFTMWRLNRNKFTTVHITSQSFELFLMPVSWFREKQDLARYGDIKLVAQ
jgi:hypothetical protein